MNHVILLIAIGFILGLFLPSTISFVVMVILLIALLLVLFKKNEKYSGVSTHPGVLPNREINAVYRNYRYLNAEKLNKYLQEGCGTEGLVIVERYEPTRIGGEPTASKSRVDNVYSAMGAYAKKDFALPGPGIYAQDRGMETDGLFNDRGSYNVFGVDNSIYSNLANVETFIPWGFDNRGNNLIRMTPYTQDPTALEGAGAPFPGEQTPLDSGLI